MGSRRPKMGLNSSERTLRNTENAPKSFLIKGPFVNTASEIVPLGGPRPMIRATAPLSPLVSLPLLASPGALRAIQCAGPPSGLSSTGTSDKEPCFWPPRALGSLRHSIYKNREPSSSSHDLPCPLETHPKISGGV